MHWQLSILHDYIIKVRLAGKYDYIAVKVRLEAKHDYIWLSKFEASLCDVQVRLAAKYVLHGC